MLVQGSAWDHVALVVKRTQPRNGTPRSQQEYPAKRRCASGYCTCSADALADGEDFALELIEATAAGVHAYPLEERLAKMARHHAYIAVRKRVGPDSTPAQLGVSTQADHLSSQLLPAHTTNPPLRVMSRHVADRLLVMSEPA